MTRIPTARNGFGRRLLIAQAAVITAGAAATWVAASLLAPSLFHQHLQQASGDDMADRLDHVEQAFTSALTAGLAIALLLSVVLTLAVAWYFTRRVHRAITEMVTSTTRIADGRYSTRVRHSRLGTEFDALGHAVNQLAERLEATEKVRTQLMSDLAHEMRTPLGIIHAHLDAIDDGVRTMDTPTMTVLRASTSRLERLTDDLTTVSRVDENYLGIVAVDHNITELIDDAITIAADRYSTAQVPLLRDIAHTATIHADADRIGQILGNLLDNALRHTPPGGRVTIATAPADTGIAITITDTGRGIDPHHLPHIFDRFYRADTARTRTTGSGSGIGLTIARALAHAHGGTLHADSDGPGHGARFTLWLPAAAAPALAPQRTATSAHP
ncbi:MAG: HAMP domain-containing protein [Gordonia polyisoprenivorans]|nr:HAMP domain-containing protein [Gordonia polyisoprenivorans]